MSSDNREALLENNSPNIIYVGEWTTVQSSVVNNLGVLGPAFSPTLKSTTTNSSFSFQFEGSSITVFGTINGTSNAETDLTPSWECSIDGVSVGPPSFGQTAKNNWPLCGPANVEDGPHELVLNVTSDGRTFYFDYLRYRASPTSSLEGLFIEIDNMDPGIDYISGWSAVPGTTTLNQTTDSNGLVNVTFVGTQLSWYGFNQGSLTFNASPSSGEYSVDGKPFTSFQIPSITPEGFFTQILFSTPTLEMGTHVLSTRYTGLPDQPPLVLQYLVVTNGSSSSSSSPTTTVSGGDTENSHPTSKNDDSSGTSSATRSSSKTGAIVGVVGSIFGLGIVIAIFFVFWKYYRRRGRGWSSSDVNPFYTEDHQLIIPEKSQIRKDRTQRSAPGRNMNSNSDIPADFSDSDSMDTNTLRTIDRTSRLPQNNSLFVMNIVSQEPPSRRRLPTIPVSAQPTNNPPFATNVVSQGSSRRPLPTIPVSARPTTLTVNANAMQHEDSGMRLPLPAVGGRNDIPPTYTEQ